jgi:hypothetical protein
VKVRTDKADRRHPSSAAGRRGAAGTPPAAPGRLARAVLVVGLVLALTPAAGAATYYVSSSSGNDGNSGTSTGSPFRTIAKVNTLNLGPGDEVRFLCGEVWRVERLVVTKSGSAAQPITFTSHPLGCANRPVLSGAQPIVGWTLDTGNVYFANLNAGANNGKFPNGINQLFRDGARLPHGRWPNLDQFSGGYSTIDVHSGLNITDDQLPGGINWIGAYVQHRAAYWYIKRREVTNDSGNTLTLNQEPICQTATCTGWGFFLNNHRQTLDQEGEWFYQEGPPSRVYVVSTTGVPPDNTIEASVLGPPLPEDPDSQTGIILGGITPPFVDVEYMVIDNLEVRDWAANGIQTGKVLKFDQDKHITIRNNKVVDVGRIGIRLVTNVFNPDPPVVPGLYGGQDMLVQDNEIDGANWDGIELLSVDSVFERNTIRNIGLLAELTHEGLGCDLEGNNCAIHGSGIRALVADQTLSGNGNTIRLNRLEQIGWTGIDMRGPFNLIEHNVIVQPSSTLGEGAGIRTYDGNNFAATRAHDITVRENVVLDSVGAFQGMPTGQNRPWGYGINIDYADDVEVTGNTIAGTAAYGLIFSFARGTATDNVLWDNSDGTSGVAHVRLLDTNNSTTRASFFGNKIYALGANRPLLAISGLVTLTGADNNYYFNPYDNRVIRSDDISTIPMTLTAWQGASGRDGGSRESWFGLPTNDPDVSVHLVNDTDASVMFPLAEPHFDLDQNVVAGSITVPAFSSEILIGDGPEILFTDGFESGDTSGWSDEVP